MEMERKKDSKSGECFFSEFFLKLGLFLIFFCLASGLRVEILFDVNFS